MFLLFDPSRLNSPDSVDKFNLLFLVGNSCVSDGVNLATTKLFANRQVLVIASCRVTDFIINEKYSTGLSFLTDKSRTICSESSHIYTLQTITNTIPEIMIQIIWAFINILSFVTFLYVCFRATKYLKNELGFFAAIVFVLGLISILSHANFDADNTNPDGSSFKKWYFQTNYNPHEIGTEVKLVTLERISINEYQLEISYKKDSLSGETIPLAAWSWMSGFSSGIYWNPTNVSVVNNAGGKDKIFVVQGSIKWKLFGLKIFDQAKNYHIVVELP